MNNLLKRTLSGILYVGTVIACLLYSKTAFCIVFAIVTGWAIDEYNRILEERGLAQPNRMMTMLAGVYLFLVLFLITTNGYSPILFLLFIPYGLTLLFLIASELFAGKPQPLANWAYSLAGQVYIALPFALLNILTYGMKEVQLSWPLSLYLFIFLWLNDSGAYVFGSLLHNKIPYRLSPHISPKKTWIGSLGGAATVLAASAVAHLCTGQMGIGFWLGMACTVIVFGTLGDLVESQMKRQVGIKDSGSFLPGHGGVLDRFDSVIFSIPAVIIYVCCYSYLFHH
ncbi:MAG: phosphatidate cytidylyltransferase [Bacteroidaceae bacterium]|nr:phosphatidate cytidylyltransferase [Bacteroidaceae bacterium]